MFPQSDSSSTIINCLMREADKFGVKIMLNAQVMNIERQAEGWKVVLAEGDRPDGFLKADYLCVATGGYPRADQYNWLKGTGHTLVPPSPSLFTFNAPGDPITALMGVAVEDAEVRVNAFKHRERGPVLITHWGLSGPAVIRLSAWLAKELEEVDYKAEVTVNWLPAYNEQRFREYLLQFRNSQGAAKVRGKSPFGLPQRLWEFLLDKSGVSQERWGELNAAVQNKLVRNLVSFVIPISGKTTFKEEFVTAGGILTTEVDPDTMQSRKCPDLYFAGEVLDVDGITGGYNFQHAWTSGYNAAHSISQKNLT
jgi:predicted Rossmann fold flavoprotein